MEKIKIWTFRAHCENTGQTVNATVEYQLKDSGVKVLQDFRCSCKDGCEMSQGRKSHSWLYHWDQCPVLRRHVRKRPAGSSAENMKAPAQTANSFI